MAKHIRKPALIFAGCLAGILTGTGWWWVRSNDEAVRERATQRLKEMYPGLEYAKRFLHTSDIAVEAMRDGDEEAAEYSIKLKVTNNGKTPVESVQLFFRLPEGWRSDVGGMNDNLQLYFEVAIPPGESRDLSKNFKPLYLGKSEQKKPITAESLEFVSADCGMAKGSR